MLKKKIKAFCEVLKFSWPSEPLAKMPLSHFSKRSREWQTKYVFFFMFQESCVCFKLNINLIDHHHVILIFN